MAVEGRCLCRCVYLVSLMARGVRLEKCLLWQTDIDSRLACSNGDSRRQLTC